jgi:hypothetical protein
LGSTTVTCTATDAAGNTATCSFSVTVITVSTWYRDNDGDGYGNSANDSIACFQPTGFVLDSTDCDDTNPFIHPNATEFCNGLDDDCDGVVDDGLPRFAAQPVRNEIEVTDNKVVFWPSDLYRTRKAGEVTSMITDHYVKYLADAGLRSNGTNGNHKGKISTAFYMKLSVEVSIELLNLSGMSMHTFHKAVLPAGVNILSFDQTLQAGVYYIKITAGGETSTDKFTVE